MLSMQFHARPAFPAPLPKTMTSLLLEFKSLKLTEFESTIQSDWPKAMQVGYSRHLYLFKFIRTKAARMHGNADFESVKMPAAAAKLEEE